MLWTEEKLKAHFKQQLKQWENGKLIQGRNELLAHFRGERLTRQDAIKAFCYECMGGYEDDALRDCENPPCPLYLYHPFNEERDKKESPKTPNPLLRRTLQPPNES